MEELIIFVIPVFYHTEAHPLPFAVQYARIVPGRPPIFLEGVPLCLKKGKDGTSRSYYLFKRVRGGWNRIQRLAENHSRAAVWRKSRTGRNLPVIAKGAFGNNIYLYVLFLPADAHQMSEPVPFSEAG